MCKEKNDTIVCGWLRSAESCSSLESGILSSWQEHNCWHLAQMCLDKVGHTQHWVPHISSFSFITCNGTSFYKTRFEEVHSKCSKILKVTSFYFNVDVNSMLLCAPLHYLKYWVRAEPFLAARQPDHSFASVWPIVYIFLVWTSISWSTELKAVLEPQGDCFVFQPQVLKLTHFIINWPEKTLPFCSRLPA